MRDPLLIPACLFAVGVAFARLEWILAGSAALVAIFLFLLALGGRLLGKRWVFAVCGGLAVLFAGTADMAWRSKAAAPAGAVGGRRMVEGCVLESVALEGGRAKVVVEAHGLGGVSVSAPASSGVPVYGEMVRGEAMVRPVRNFGLEGAFDRETFLSRRGVFWQASMGSKGRWERLGGVCGNPVERWLDSIRRAAAGRLSLLYAGQERQTALMQALLLGDGSALRRSWSEDFRRTGTYHALVISGGHITVLCGAFLLWRRRVGWGGRTAVLLGAGLAWFYSFVAGGSTPALRAAAALSLAAAGMLLYRSPRLMNILAAVALVFLAADPGQLFEASFQLSFLAVAAIGLLAQPWWAGGGEDDGLPRPLTVERRLLAKTLSMALGGAERLWDAALGGLSSTAAWVGQALLVSAAIQLGLLLPMVVYFHRLSATGLIANVVVTPLISLAIPAGFGAMIFNSAHLARVASWLMARAQWLAAIFAQWEPHWPVPDPPLWLAAAFIVCLFLTILALGIGRRLAMIPLAAALATGGVVAVHPFKPQQQPGELELTLLDTGQSESLLVGLPQGGFVLIDTGGTAGRLGVERRIDVGEDLIAPYLWGRGIRRLDELVLTHLHADHAGGAPFLIRSFRPRKLRTGYTPDHPLWRRLEREARAAGAAVSTAERGTRWNWGEVEARVLAPSPEQRWRGKPSNNDSLVFQLAYGRRRFLLTGDAERGVGDRLAEEGLLERVDVLKMPHHGARSALSHAFLERTRPALALISAGWQNPFGFPHPETLAALRAQGSIPLRTDLSGTVTIRTDGRTLSFESIPGSGF